jgi:hypothetical protein
MLRGVGGAATGLKNERASGCRSVHILILCSFLALAFTFSSSLLCRLDERRQMRLGEIHLLDVDLVLLRGFAIGAVEQDGRRLNAHTVVLAVERLLQRVDRLLRQVPQAVLQLLGDRLATANVTRRLTEVHRCRSRRPT